MDRVKPAKILAQHKAWLGGNADGARANLRGANLREADLSEADLSWADLSEADLGWADLREANLREANLSEANLSWANLSEANLRWANLSGANLGGAIGLLSPREWLEGHFQATGDGWIVYRAQRGYFAPPSRWKYEQGAILTEVCHPGRTIDCACGVSFATLEWLQKHVPGDTYWRCLIPWKYSCGIVVPYNTGGKARCDYLQLLWIVE